MIRHMSIFAAISVFLVSLNGCGTNPYGGRIDQLESKLGQTEQENAVLQDRVSELGGLERTSPRWLSTGADGATRRTVRQVSGRRGAGTRCISGLSVRSNGFGDLLAAFQPKCCVRAAGHAAHASRTVRLSRSRRVLDLSQPGNGSEHLFPQPARDRDLGQLEDDRARMPNQLRTDLDQALAEAGQ